MDNIETWKSLDRDIEIPKAYDCAEVLDNVDGLRFIFVCEDDKKVKVIFDTIVYSYRNSIDSAFWETLHYLHTNYEPSFYKNEWLYEVKNSGYLKWLEKESGGLYTSDRVRHFVFYTEEEIIEVLGSSPPKIIVEDIPAETTS